jgi:hypothetical protein
MRADCDNCAPGGLRQVPPAVEPFVMRADVEGQLAKHTKWTTQNAKCSRLTDYLRIQRCFGFAVSVRILHCA